MDYIDKYKKITADIIISARKKKGLTQAELSKHLNIAQSTISRIEAETLTPSIFTWFEIANFLEVPVESIKDGYLDQNTDSEITSGAFENGFKLKSKYSKLKCLKIRSIMPFIYFIIDKYGQEEFEKICDEMGLSPSFFINLDNQINIISLSDALNILKDKYCATFEDLKEISNYIGLEKAHGHLAKEYDQARTHKELLALYIKNASKYHSVFDVKVIEDETTNCIKISSVIVPEIKKQIDKKCQNVIKFLEFYKEINLKYFLQMKSDNLIENSNLSLTKVKSYTDGDKCIEFLIGLN